MDQGLRSSADATQAVAVTRNSEMQMVIAFLTVGLIEFFTVHLALRAAPSIVRFMHTAISQSFLLYLLAGCLSLKFNQVRVLENGLRIPISLIGHIVVHYNCMESVERLIAVNTDNGVLKAFMVMSEPNLLITARTAEAVSTPSFKARHSGFAIAIDNPDQLAKCLKARIAEV